MQHTFIAAVYTISWQWHIKALRSMRGLISFTESLSRPASEQYTNTLQHYRYTTWLCYLLQLLHSTITALIWQSVALICIRLHAHRGKLSLMGSIILCRWQEKKTWVGDTKVICLLKYSLVIGYCRCDDIHLCSEISFSTAQSLFININCTIPQCGHINPDIFLITISGFFILGLLSPETLESW